jgi:hypothetical protein
MDSITSSFLDSFVESKGYSHFDQSKRFEYFVNFCIINKEYDSISFDEKQISTGKATQGIDGIGIIVNNKLCHSVSEIQQLIDLNRVLNVTFVIVQAKISAKFDGAQIENLFRWSKEFFSANPDLFMSDEMKNFIDMKNFIYESKNTKFMKERSPNCCIYYCTTGKWGDDPNLTKIIAANKKELDSNLFDNVSFTPCGAKELQSLYRKTKAPVEATITFEKKVTIPAISQIKVAYSGMLPFLEFRKIIIDDSGKMKSVFEDNIRDYLRLDDNPVNADISNTLQHGVQEQFCILNNGVTIVADEISGAGDTITITNYQIVNGCQTSNVLYENRSLPGIDNLHVPVKIIVTNDSNIKSQITRATNNQTAVNAVELEALSEFQRSLELFYNAQPSDEYKLYYERRTNQYKSDDKVPLKRIVDRENQIKSFSAMFCNNPHLVAGNFGKLTREMGTDIFNSEHDQIAYYTSALSYYKLEEYLNKDLLLENSKRFRYQILMLFRFISTKNTIPNLKSKTQTKENCEKLIEILRNDTQCLQNFKEAATFLESENVELDFKDRKTVERKQTTDILIEKIKAKIFNIQPSSN